MEFKQNMLKVSAPGKIHLIGEHAVVYGYPAIIAAINKRIKIKVLSFHSKIKLKPEKKIKIVIIRNGEKLKKEFEIKECKETARKAVKAWEEGNGKGDFSLLFKFLRSSSWVRLESLVGFLLNYFEIEKGFFLRIESEIQPGMGLGSSAALSVALTKGISSFLDIDLPNKKVNEISYKIEKLNHGRPSGGDNTISTSGGLIFFEKGKFEKMKIPCFLENLTVVLTKRVGSTGELIQKVKNLDKKMRESLIEDIGGNVNKLKNAIQDENFENFKQIINDTQGDLTKLHVSTSKIDGIVKKVREANGAAKLSGAGGGGAVLCFHSDKEKLISILKKIKVPFFEARIEKDGVKIENPVPKEII